ncbi:MAG: DUF6660 family protein [Bacteroidales bacterium]
MKLFCYIFLIYIINILVYPCRDNGNISFVNKSANSNQNHDEQDCHTCPPFCICNCCQVNTITSLKMTIKTIKTIPIIFVSIYKETPLKDIIFSIWQPPKF